MSWLEPLTRTRLYGVLVVAAAASSVTYAIVHSLVIEPLRDRVEQQGVENRESSHLAEASLGEASERITELEKALAHCQSELSHQLVSRSPQNPCDSGLPEAPAALATPPSTDASRNVGTYNYQAKVSRLPVWGHGSGDNDQLQLILEEVGNQPATDLTFSFLVENPENYGYSIWLSNPDDAARVLDDLRGEHKLIKAEGIRDTSPLEIPAFSRRRFKLSFEFVGPGPQSISFQTAFIARAYSNIGGQGETLVAIENISLSRLE